MKEQLKSISLDLESLRSDIESAKDTMDTAMSELDGCINKAEEIDNSINDILEAEDKETGLNKDQVYTLLSDVYQNMLSMIDDRLGVKNDN